jgi:hypothetical protein
MRFARWRYCSCVLTLFCIAIVVAGCQDERRAWMEEESGFGATIAYEPARVEIEYPSEWHAERDGDDWKTTLPDVDRHEASVHFGSPLDTTTCDSNEMARAGETLRDWAMCFVDRVLRVDPTYLEIEPPRAIRGVDVENMEPTLALQGETADGRKVLFGFATRGAGDHQVAIILFVAPPDIYERYEPNVRDIIASMRPALTQKTTLPTSPDA